MPPGLKLLYHTGKAFRIVDRQDSVNGGQGGLGPNDTSTQVDDESHAGGKYSGIKRVSPDRCHLDAIDDWLSHSFFLWGRASTRQCSGQIL